MSPRRQRFVNAYIGEAGGNATKAAVIAGYSQATARQAGSRLLSFPEVREAIQAGEHAAQEQAGLSATAIMTELSAIATRPVEKVSANAKLKALELIGKASGLFKDEQQDSRVVVNIGFLGELRPAAKVMASLPLVSSVE